MSIFQSKKKKNKKTVFNLYKYKNVALEIPIPAI